MEHPKKTSWPVVLLLIVFFPVGLWMMWSRRTWSVRTRGIVSGVGVGLVAIFVAVGATAPATPTAVSLATKQAAAQKASAEQAAAKEAAAEKAAADQAAAKEAAAEKAAADQAAAKEEAAKEAAARAAAAKVAAAKAAAEKAAAARAYAFAHRPYLALGVRDFALLAKNPDSYKDKRYVVYGQVSQFDSATGLDTFLADTGPSQSWPDEFGYVTGYDQNTELTGDPNLLKNVVEGDLVVMKVEVLGSDSYMTQIGGNTTVPKLHVDSISVYGHVK